MKITNPITLDVARSNSYICLLAKQFDSNSRYLEITLADNGQPLTIPADASAVLRATRADGTGAVVSGTVANGKATVEIDDYILEVNGAVTLSLEISKDGETLTTPSCNLTIQKADANGWIRVYVADANKVAGNYYITIGGVSYSFTTSQAIPTGGSVYFSSNNATAETRDATGTVIETGLVLTEGTTGTQLVTDVPTMSFLATIAGRVAALESEMPNKADKDGIIALAENLTPYSSTSGATQSVPFNNQGTGTGNGESVVDTGSYCQLKKKLGNTVGVNQIVYTNADWASSDNGRGTLTDNVWKVFPTSNTKKYAAAKASATMVYYPRHTYLFHYRVLEMSPGVTSAGFGFNSLITSLNSPGDKYFIIDLDRDRTVVQAVISGSSNLDTSEYANFTEPYCIDLDVWFGGHDNIPAHLLAHPEDWGRYYAGSLAYAAGYLDSADGSVLTSIGRNCNSGDGDVLAIPNQAYYCKGTATITYKDRGGNTISTASVTNTSFTTPADCFSFGVSGTGVTISLYYSGESGYDSDYPFSVLAQIDTGSEVLRSAGAVADEKTPDGTITRNILDLDLGDLNWMLYSGYTSLFYVNTTTLKGAPSNSSISNVKCAKYVACPAQVIGGSGYTDGYVAVDINGRIYINDPNYTSAAAFKPAMSGVHLYAEAVTPTTEQGTPFSGASADNFAVDDFGSMYWTQSAGVPQGVEIFYPYDYKAAVDTILNEVNGDVTKLVTAEKVPDAPSSNGAYVLKVTVSDGTPTYSWVAE